MSSLLENFKSLIEEQQSLKNDIRAKTRELGDTANAIDITFSEAVEQATKVRTDWTAYKNDFTPTLTELNQKLQDAAQAIKNAKSSGEIDDASYNEFLSLNKSNNDDTKALNNELRGTLKGINDVLSNARNGTNTTNKDASAENTEKKLENSSTVAPSTADTSNVDSQTSYDTGNNNTVGQGTNSLGRTISLPVGAMPPKPNPVNVTFKNMAGEQQPQDMRVKIRVPKNYLTLYTKGTGNKDGVLGEFGGIIFPYQPSISYEHKAEYNMQTPLHSNYTQYFYKNSQVTPINISGKFSVSNENEAIVYIATVHLLRSLTKMRFGGSTGDADSGAPPPVCRLDAYGTFMLQNVPVVINSFKIDLTENMDFYTLGKRSGSLANTLYEKTAVPILSTISIGLLPVYSRDEIQKFNVTQWLNEKYVRKAGYL